MLGSFVFHVITYVAVCSFLSAIWVLTGDGSIEDLSRIASDRTLPLAADLGFWPIWVWLSWGTAVVIHFGLVVWVGLFGRKARARRRELRRQAARTAVEIAKAAGPALDAHRSRHRERSARQGSRERRPPASAEAPSERRWVTVMFTDIANSTTLNEVLGDEAWNTVLRRHRDVVRRAFLERGGSEVNVQGDGFFARFTSPAEAVLCAVDIQKDNDRLGELEGVELKLRIGVHAGEAVEAEGDLVGRVINLASRVAAEAVPGEILVTEPVADYLGGKLRFEDRGLRELRGLAQPRHLLAVVWNDDA